MNYKLRDWLFSRQRYWGEPFPIIHWEDGEISLVDVDDLPLTLPDLQEYIPGEGGESPLANSGDWLDVVDPATGRKGRRETNTMPQWAGSCWYYLRYMDPKNDSAAWDAEVEKYWMPVDLYVGGAEHAVLHLLYSRFWHKVLFDLGHVSTDEPFQKLFNQGMILAHAYEDSVGSKVASDLVETRDNNYFHIETGQQLKQIVAKMSKTLKNVVNPDDVVDEFGADTLRLYEMFMGPLQAAKPWNTESLAGVNRFLQRVWRLFIAIEGTCHAHLNDQPATREQQRVLHQTIRKVTKDIESMDFNTGISQLMIFVNAFSGAEQLNREVMVDFLKLVSPFAPHLAEEIWQRLGNPDTLAYEPWPVFDESLAAVDEVEILVQIKGKPKARIVLPPTADAKTMEETALAHEDVQAAIAGPDRTEGDLRSWPPGEHRRHVTTAHLRLTEQGIELLSHVQAGAKRTEFAGCHGDALKLRLAALPVDGKANKEILRFLANHCNVTRRAVCILAGAKSRRKRLSIHGELQALCARLEFPAAKDLDRGTPPGQ